MWQLNVDGCIWIGKVDREGGGGKSMRDLAREGGTGWVGDKTDSNWCCYLRSLS